MSCHRYLSFISMVLGSGEGVQRSEGREEEILTSLATLDAVSVRSKFSFFLKPNKLIFCKQLL